MKKTALSLLVVLLAASNTFADDRPPAFTNADINGNYGLLGQGMSVVPGTPIAFPAIYVGKASSDGKGNLLGAGTINPGGSISGLAPGQAVMITGTYDVDSDGTGTFTATGAPASPSAPSNSSAPPSVQLGGALVIESLDQIQVVSTQTDRVLYTTIKKQLAPSGGFSNATLRGAWGFVCHGALVTSTGDPTAVESPVAVVGLMTNDGRGKFSAEITANTNGVVSQETFTGTNSVASDGTITATATAADPLLANLRGIIDNDHEFRVITIDAGTIVGCTFNAQRRPGDSRD